MFGVLFYLCIKINFRENLSEPILYQWIEKIRECLQFFPPLTEKKKKNYNIFEFTSDDVEVSIKLKIN